MLILAIVLSCRYVMAYKRQVKAQIEMKDPDYYLEAYAATEEILKLIPEDQDAMRFQILLKHEMFNHTFPRMTEKGTSQGAHMSSTSSHARLF